MNLKTEGITPKDTITYLKNGYNFRKNINRNTDNRLLSIAKLLERKRECTK